MRVARTKSGLPDNPPELGGEAPVLQPFAGQRGVRHHDAVDAIRFDHADDGRKVGIGDIGGELDEKRRPLLRLAPRLLHPREQRSEHLRRLQVAQARRVGR